MLDIVFVHGTGVREPGYQNTLDKVRTSLATVLPQAQVHACYWGDLGATIGTGASIPGYPQKMGIDDYDEGLNDDGWAALLYDPLVELRVLAAQPVPTDDAPGMHAGGRLLARLYELRENASLLSADLPGALDWSVMQASIRAVCQFEGTSAALDVVLASPGDSPDADAGIVLTRAVVAGWMCRLLEQDYPAPLGSERDRLVAEIGAILGVPHQQKMGLVNDAALALLAPIKFMARATIADPSLRAATWGGKLLRNRLADLTTPAIGDVVLYQARGKPIRDKILQTVEQVGRPVVLVAHSLGGIACIDLLIEAARPNIKAIVTAGSQAPFLFEIGALCALARTGALPAYMPPWLNFYDRNDILSFLAAPVMHGPTVVEDIEVFSKQPFPASHSAYWSNPALWYACADFLLQHAPHQL